MARVIDFKTKEVLADTLCIQSVKMHRLYTFHASVEKYFGKLFVIAITPKAGKLRLLQMYSDAERIEKESAQ